MEYSDFIESLRKFIREEMMNENRRDKALFLLELLEEVLLEESFVRSWWKEIRSEM